MQRSVTPTEVLIFRVVNTAGGTTARREHIDRPCSFWAGRSDGIAPSSAGYNLNDLHVAVTLRVCGIVPSVFGNSAY
jgi:hypothetical protein